MLILSVFFFTNVFNIAIYSPIVCSVEIGQRVAIWGVSSTYWTVLSAKWQILAAYTYGTVTLTVGR